VFNYVCLFTYLKFFTDPERARQPPIQPPGGPRQGGVPRSPFENPNSLRIGGRDLDPFGNPMGKYS
jgi:hypothetical protein